MRTDRERERESVRQVDMAKLIVALPNFANAPKNQSVIAVRELIAIYFRNLTKPLRVWCDQDSEMQGVS